MSKIRNCKNIYPMKILKTSAVCVLLTLCFFSSMAQELPLNEPDYNKPKLFSDLPDRIQVNVSALESLLEASEGKIVSAAITGSVVLNGVVVSKSDPNDPSVKSIVVKLSNRAGATLTFTKVLNQDKTISYLGRILSRNNSDAYEVVSDNGQYYFIKKHYYDIINE